MAVANPLNSLSIYGITDPGVVHWNLDVETLINHAIQNDEGTLAASGALVCFTGDHTGRSPKDKFIVETPENQGLVHWGAVNLPMTSDHFAALRADQLEYLKQKHLYVVDSFAGADPRFRIPIRAINETAWANLFCKQLFIRPKREELAAHDPKFTIIHTPNFCANPKLHGTNSDTFIVVHFGEGLILIGGTRYAGEMKKSIFSVLNYLYPLQGVLSMHCSANVHRENTDDVALFFGLSGTGKTTLSADPNRRLIGDDEHGWSDQGVFNFEGGCYAKCIRLAQEKEPQIWSAIRRGTVLENVIINPSSKEPDYNDASVTENTRAAYPVEFIDNAVLSGVGKHPKNIFFLTCDAFGVMPPIAKLSTEQAMYHFLSGYTAKVAGTERGTGNDPQTTFSACFGAPFLPLKPTVYADLLGQKMNTHRVNCWLINTGWSGGGFGVGQRIQLAYTRKMITEALNGTLQAVNYESDPIFGLNVPQTVSDIPKSILMPRNAWKDHSTYDQKAKNLAEQFKENFKKFEAHAPELVKAGPIN